MRQLVLLGIGLLLIATVLLIIHKPQEAKCPKLDTVLFKLSQSSNPKEYASKQGLFYSNGRIRVEIKLTSQDVRLPNKYSIQVEKRYRDLLQALVPIDKLCPLSNEPQVKLVQAPIPSVTD